MNCFLICNYYINYHKLIGYESVDLMSLLNSIAITQGKYLLESLLVTDL